MYKPQSPDTDERMDRLYFERLRTMTPVERLQRVSDLGRLALDIALGALSVKYPGSTVAENRLRVLSRRVDRETMIRLYDWDPDERGM